LPPGLRKLRPTACAPCGFAACDTLPASRLAQSLVAAAWRLAVTAAG